MTGWRFADPWVLLLIPVVIAATVWAVRRRERVRSHLPLPRAAAALALGRSSWVRLARALPWARCAVLVLVVVGLARPQAGSRIEDVASHGVDIVLALDVSRSMSAEDFQPDNRLAVAKRTARQFVRGRAADRIGLVVFGSVAATRCPLTLDHDLLGEFLEQVELAPPEQAQTAIGLGLATAVNRLRQSEAESKLVVLLTDGENTAGQIGPQAAAAAATALGIKVYTVGVGSDDEVPVPIDTPFGRRMGRMRFELDEELLQEIAATTHGRYFRATDAATLGEIFETIDRLERSELRSRVRVLYTELFPFAVAPALVLFGLETFLRATRLRRLP